MTDSADSPGTVAGPGTGSHGETQEAPVPGLHPAVAAAAAAEAAARALTAALAVGEGPSDADLAAMMPAVRGTLSVIAGCLSAVGGATAAPAASGYLSAAAGQVRAAARGLSAVQAAASETARLQEQARTGRAAETAWLQGTHAWFKPEDSLRPDLVRPEHEDAYGKRQQHRTRSDYTAWARSGGAGEVLAAAGLDSGLADPAAATVLDAHCDAYELFALGQPRQHGAGSATGHRYLKDQMVVTALGNIAYTTGETGPGGGPYITYDRFSDDGAAFPRAAIQGPLVHVLDSGHQLLEAEDIVAHGRPGHSLADGDVIIAGGGEPQIITGKTIRPAGEVRAAGRAALPGTGRYDASVRLAAEAAAPPAPRAAGLHSPGPVSAGFPPSLRPAAAGHDRRRRPVTGAPAGKSRGPSA